MGVVGKCDDYRGFLCFFFNDTATTEIYTLSLHDALPISNVFLLRNLRFQWFPILKLVVPMFS